MALPSTLDVNPVYKYNDVDVFEILTTKIARLPSATRGLVNLTSIADAAITVGNTLTQIIQTFHQTHTAVVANQNDPDILLIPYNTQNLTWVGIVITVPADRNTVTANYIPFSNDNAIVPQAVPLSITAAVQAVYTRVNVITENIYSDANPANSGPIIIESLFTYTQAGEIAAPQRLIATIREEHIHLIDPVDSTFYDRQFKRDFTLLDGNPAKDAILARLGDQRLSRGEFARANAVYTLIQHLNNGPLKNNLISAFSDNRTINIHYSAYYKLRIIMALLELTADPMQGEAPQLDIKVGIIQTLLRATYNQLCTSFRTSPPNTNYDFVVTTPELFVVGGLLQPSTMNTLWLNPEDFEGITNRENEIRKYQSKFRTYDSAQIYLGLITALIMALLEITRIFVVSTYPSDMDGNAKSVTTNNIFTYVTLAVPLLFAFIAGILQALKYWNLNDLRNAQADLRNFTRGLNVTLDEDNPLLQVPTAAPTPAAQSALVAPTANTFNNNHGIAAVPARSTPAAGFP